VGAPPRPGTRPTEREIEALIAYVEEGSQALAAMRLGVAESTIRGLLANVRSRTRSLTTAQAVYRLARSGRLKAIPSKRRGS